MEYCTTAVTTPPGAAPLESRPCTSRALSVSPARPAHKASCGAGPGIAYGTQHTQRPCHAPRGRCQSPMRPARRASCGASTSCGSEAPRVACVTAYAAPYHRGGHPRLYEAEISPPHIPCDTDSHGRTSQRVPPQLFIFGACILYEKKRCPTPRKPISGFAHILQNPMAKTGTVKFFSISSRRAKNISRTPYLSRVLPA